MISVVVPVGGLDRALLEQVAALAAQQVNTEFEVVLSANTIDAVVALSATDLPPGFRIVDSSAVAGPSAARNAGWRAAHGKTVLFCDADDVVGAGWIQRLADLAKTHSIFGGPLDYELLNEPGRGRWVHDWSAGLPIKYGHLPFLPSANLGVSRALLEELDGFDQSLRACEDTDLCWRAQELGYEIRFDSEAVVHYRLRTSYGAVWRQSLSYGQYDIVFARRRGFRPSWTGLAHYAIRSLVFQVRAAGDRTKRLASVGKWGVLAGRARAMLLRG